MSQPPTKRVYVPTHPLRVLIVEHSQPDAELVLQEIKKAGFKVRADLVDSPEDFVQRVRQHNYDVILADYRLPKWTGMDALALLHQEGKVVPFILVTGTLGEDMAVECIKQGITDYVLKDRVARLPVAIRRALEERALAEERARNEQALRQSEESFRLLFANSPLPMWVYDTESLRFLQVNDAAVAHYGYSREEFLRMRITDIRPPDAVFRPLQELEEERPPLNFAGLWRHQLKDGRVVEVEVSLHQVPFAGRDAALVVGQDVTDRRRAEQALRESEIRYRVVAETATDAIITINAESKILFVNAAAARIFGYGRSELLGNELTMLMPKYLRHLHKAGLKGYLATGEKNIHWESTELTGLHKSGQEIPLEVSFGEFTAEGQHAFTGIVRDITERKRAEESLRRSEARYREFIENATYGIYRATLSGTFLEVNPALVHMLGYASKDELLSTDRANEIYLRPEDRQRLLDQFRQRGGIQGAEVEWKRKDGSCITARLSGRTVPAEHGDEQELEVIVEDVTERRAMERHLRQVHKFEAIGQLAGGIAHDFNNVISAILGWADLGQEQTPADSRIHVHFRKIHEQAERAAGLTRQLLAFARRQILESRNINLNDTVADLLGLFEKVIGGGIELKTSTAPGLAGVRADPTQLEQVLMNLCLNARDAMPQGGELRIETQNVEINEEFSRSHAYARAGPYVRLAVSDTGMGMDAATREHIFEPFFTTKEMGKGTGLGLATVFGIVKQHGGFVEVFSEPRRGSTFHVYLPAAGALLQHAEKKEKPAAEPPRGGTETILVAEDHEGVREMARTTLEGLGYRVLLASDGDHALQVFEAHRGDLGLALLDLVMPKASGHQVYAKMAECQPGLPVVFTTGYSTELASLNKLAEAGIAILQKPYSPAQLARRVREALDRARVAHSPAASPRTG